MAATQENTQKQQLDAAMAAMTSDNYIIHTIQDKNNKYHVKISPKEGKENDLKYNFACMTVPFKAKWPELHGDGTYGKKFAPEKAQARFTVDLEAGGLSEVLNKDVQLLEEYQVNFLDRIDAIGNEIADHIFNDKHLCAKKKKSMLKNAKQQVATLKKVDVKSLSNTDPDVIAMQKAAFMGNMNKLVNRDGDTPSLKVKTRVFQRVDWRDPNSEEVNKPVPIFDEDNKQLNAETNKEAFVERGDIVYVKFRFKPYIIPSGAFGVGCDLASVTKICSANEHRPNKRRKVDISFKGFS